MWEEGRWLLGLVLAPCLVSVLLGWTLAVYQSARSRWRRLDPVLVALLVLALLRQGVLGCNAALRLFRPRGPIYCGLLLWFASALEYLQPAALATLAVAALLRVRPGYTRLVTKSHVSYHLVVGAVFSSCLGLAALLARPLPCDPPALADPRYTLFNLALRSSLALLSALCLLFLACRPPPPPMSSSSTSDLSSTISDASSPNSRRHYLISQMLYSGKNLDPDATYNVSTTSSTNSRACLAKPKPIQDVPRLATAAVLIVGLAANQVPILGGQLVDWLWPGWWDLSGMPAWSTLLEGLLLPVVLALTDKEFLDRVARVYTRRRPPDFTRPPQGLYGKFLQRGSMMQRPLEPVRFPLTNGSLFTSLDGRLPLVHNNYRRHKGAPYRAGSSAGQLTRCPTHGSQGLAGAPRPAPTVVDQLRHFLAEDDSVDPVYASLSSNKSVCSATTTANDDFEYFQNRQASSTTEATSPPVLLNTSSESMIIHEQPQPMMMRGPCAIRSGGVLGYRRSIASRFTPPVKRRQASSSPLAPVLSMDSLVAALHKAETSFLDNGDLCRHKWESVPDLKRIFHSDYL